MKKLSIFFSPEIMITIFCSKFLLKKFCSILFCRQFLQKNYCLFIFCRKFLKIYEPLIFCRNFLQKNSLPIIFCGKLLWKNMNHLFFAEIFFEQKWAMSHLFSAEISAEKFSSVDFLQKISLSKYKPFFFLQKDSFLFILCSKFLWKHMNHLFSAEKFFSVNLQLHKPFNV